MFRKKSAAEIYDAKIIKYERNAVKFERFRRDWCDSLLRARSGLHERPLLLESPLCGNATLVLESGRVTWGRLMKYDFRPAIIAIQKEGMILVDDHEWQPLPAFKRKSVTGRKTAASMG